MIKDTGGGTILYIYIHPLHNPLAWRGDLFTSKYYWIMDKKVKIGTPQKFVCNRFNPLWHPALVPSCKLGGGPNFLVAYIILPLPDIYRLLYSND